MRKLALLLILLLLPAMCFAVEIENPRLLGQISMSFSGEGTLSSINTEEVTIKNYFYPKNASYSSVGPIITMPSAEQHANYYRYNWESPREETYSLFADIDGTFYLTKVPTKIPFPYQNLPSEVQIYTKPTEKIDSDSSIIVQKANELLIGEDDAYEAIFKLAAFTNQEIEYNLDYFGRQEKASNVLLSKEGVCAEYSTLYAALARSVGIPTRVVSGVAYGNVYGSEFNAHAWTEVYLPTYGWVSVDPTFGEIGWVDPAHIYMQTSDLSSPKTIEYTWKGGQIDITTPKIDVEVKTVDIGLPEYIDTQIEVQESDIGFGSYNIIVMKLLNTQPFYVATDAYLTKSPEIVGDNQQAVLLEPFGDEIVSWAVKLPDDLEEGYKYSYKIEGTSLFGSISQAEFTVSKDGTYVEVEEKLTAKIKPTSDLARLDVHLLYADIAFVGEGYNITVSVKNNGNAPEDKLSVCLQDACQNEYVGIGEQKEIVFYQTPIVEGLDYFKIIMSGSSFQTIQEGVEIRVLRRDPLDRFLMSLSNFIAWLMSLA